MARNDRPYEDDDGRTICSMDVDGMPGSAWQGLRGKHSRRQERETLRQKVDRGEALTQSEAKRYTRYSVLAGLTVLGVVGGGTVLFIFILWLLWR